MSYNKTTVYIKVHGRKRGSFVDPQDFDWGNTKDHDLWQEISKSANINVIDWAALSSKFEAPEYFLKKRVYYIFSKQIEMLENVKESVLSKQAIKNDLKIHRKQSLENAQNSENQSLRELAKETSASTELRGKTATIEAHGSSHGATSSPETQQAKKDLNVLMPVRSSSPKSSDQTPKEKLDLKLSPPSSMDISSSALAEALLDRLDISD